MDFNDIEKLMDDFKKSEMRELEITTDGFHIHLSKNEIPFLPVREKAEQPAITAVEENVPPVTKDTQAEGEFIKSPMVGSVYLQPKPDQDPYVTVGSRVHKGDVVCIIEAMKMMTEIKSDQDGIVTEVLVENEDLVEFDQPLFKVGRG
ncbi:acetyl-CoA carboxylase biotin carboxyl carrier protein [Ligilactobacillus animalis]|uniref:Biotin carboxyl carrier protein of acetyl-CoA carboxylase n=1 Tax=Ligilactobacillus animalis TaxID=1605 RepID=A0ABR4RML9_9LACO|nr:acetyl-CoA carboxylase biotin carboxyl carrier protein [Ligilactobacillus animalis]KDA45294.1 acetyl-CoA carboxylase, biotin carboxyl carrier protein, accB [Ligilactobacillus animalis]MEE0261949.1 acetyl-CoA carboxylase biotin carboxyl carrier protein [Ligilactobacillus animalis]PNQ52556.1 acetyl-CoA carboxylase biotin carboxyl carrier protein [Ligilactobacillus animalis]